MLSEKEQIREKYYNLRMNILPNDHLLLSKSITSNLVSFISKFKTVHTFLPINSKNEYNAFNLINTEALYGKKWATSIMLNSKELRHTEIFTNSEFHNNRLGIPTPKKLSPIDLNQIDLVLVPLLAVDYQGQRVGYGQGYYDRFLSKLKPETVFCGISFFAPLTKLIPAEKHDIPLHYCACPFSVIPLGNNEPI